MHIMCNRAGKMEIPVEIWGSILAYSNLSDLVNLRQTSKQFKKIVDFYEPALAQPTQLQALLYAVKRNGPRLRTIMKNLRMDWLDYGRDMEDDEIDVMCDVLEAGLPLGLGSDIIDKFIGRFDDNVMLELLSRFIDTDNPYADVPFEWFVDLERNYNIYKGGYTYNEDHGVRAVCNFLHNYGIDVDDPHVKALLVNSVYIGNDEIHDPCDCFECTPDNFYLLL